MGTSYYWNNPAGGSYDVPTDWAPNGIPGTLDAALFELGGYTYTVSDDGTPAFLQIIADTVTFSGSIEAVGTSTGYTALEVGGFGAAIFDGGTLYAQAEVMLGDYYGDGTLEFIDGAVGTLTAIDTADALDIGFYGAAQGAAPSTGSVLVDASTLTILGGAYVGVFSAGSLTITDGASVQFISTAANYDALEVAVNDPSVTGVITVDGGATLDVGVYTYIGVNGDGTLAVSGGAGVTLDGLSVANNGYADAGDAPDTGLVTVDGSLTSLTLNGQVVIGFEGNATLAITDSADVQVLAATGTDAVDYVTVGDTAQSTGTVTVTSGGTFDVGEYTDIGSGGTGVVSFTDGATGSFSGLGYDSAAGTYTANFAVNLGFGGSGTLSLDGSLTSVSADAGMLAGAGAGGTGLISLTNGATLAITTDSLGAGIYFNEIGGVSGASGTLDVSGGAQLTGNSAMFVGDSGDGTIAITTGGTVVSDAAAGNVDAVLGYQVGGDGTGLIDDGEWLSDQSFSVGYQGSGTLVVQDGGVLQINGTFLRIARDPGATGTLTVNAGNIYAQSAELTVGPAATNTGDGTGGSGTLEIENGAPVYVGSAEIGGLAGGAGSIDVTSASGLDITDGDFVTGAGSSVVTAEDSGGIGVSGSITIGGGGGSALVQLTDSGNLYAYGGGIEIGALGTIALDASAGLVPTNGPLTLDGGTLDALASRGFAYDVDITGGSVAHPSAIIGAAGAVLTLSNGITFVTTSVTVDSVPTIVPDVLLAGPAFNTATEINDFAAGDTIDLAGSIYNTASYDTAAAKLVLTGSSPALTLNIADNGYSAGSFSAYSDGNGGTDVSLGPPPCYLAGTHVMTPEGERRIETLRAGDHVTLARGGSAPLVWVGERKLDPAAHPRPWEVQPIRIRRGAFAAGLPYRDLLLSPDHALLLHGVLVEAKRLLNGRTIVQENARAAHYFHLELATHDVLLAEGVAAESYLDTGNRHAFGAGATALHPNFAAPASARAALCCAPFATDPALVQPIWQRLAERAAALGHAATPHAATADPALRLLADGRAIPAIPAPGGALYFALPRGTRRLHLASLAARPTWCAPWLDDRRTLGVAVSRLRLHHGGAFCDLALDSPHLRAGWWDLERAGAAAYRWTNGCGVIVLPDAADCLELRARPLDAYPARPAAADGFAARARSG